MRLVIIIGSGAVGKMTVGQALMRQTGLRLFHNHMMIEPVIEIFAKLDGRIVMELRDVVFKRFLDMENYLRIDNTNLSPEEAANLIRERFGWTAENQS